MAAIFTVGLYPFMRRLDHKILSVNSRNLVNVTHQEAVQVLREAGSTVTIVVATSTGIPISPLRKSQSPVARYVNIVLIKEPGRGECVLACEILLNCSIKSLSILRKYGTDGRCVKTSIRYHMPLQICVKD